MATTKTLQRSFAGGEVTPEFFGRIDDVKYQTGAATMRNFIALPHGPAVNRPGFAYVNKVKDSTKRTRLIPFVYSTDQTYVIELGAGYFRFHVGGVTLKLSGRPFEVTNSYSEGDLFDIHYVQSADVLTLVHPNYPPGELRRAGTFSWTFVTPSFSPQIAAPVTVNVAPTLAASPNNLVNYSYVITALTERQLDESVASTASTPVANNLFQTGAYNTITWSASAGAARYNVYKESNGLYGYIGQGTASGTFVDNNIAADFSKTPPLEYSPVPFTSTGNYPGAVSYFEQRRCFAGTNNDLQKFWMTRSGTESNMTYSLPTQSVDSLAVRIASQEASTIRHLISLNSLIMLTNSSEWRVTSITGDAITPNSVSAKMQSAVGANNVQPVVISNNVIYAAARGGHVRELAYSFQADGYVTGDISLRAPHLFNGLTIVDMAYAKSPQPICWAVSSNGKLLGLTYIPEQQVGAWHQHDTDGLFESIAVVAEGEEDALYVVVRRTINGADVRYIERMASQNFATPEDAFFVDAGYTFTAAPGGYFLTFYIPHLKGKTINILANGAVHPPRTVAADGAVTLDSAATKVQAGLPITADLKTLPAVAQVDAAFGQGRYKNVNKAWLRVYRSSGIFVGPDENTLTEVKQRTTEAYGSPPALKSEEVQVTVSPSWGDAGQILIRQTDPLPLTVASVTLEIVLGG